MSYRTVHIHTKQLASLQWGHQEVPARFNFASDVMDYWAGMEKVMGGQGTFHTKFSQYLKSKTF